MDGWVVPLVLLAAVMHAGWNSLLKGGGDRLVGITMLNVWCGVAGLVVLPFAGPLPPAAWPYLAASLLFHLAYQLFLVRTYRLGDLSQVYPVARGAAPPLVALVGLALGTDALRLPELLSILLIAGGIAALALRGGGAIRHDPRPVMMALVTAAFIAGYTTVDGLGARASGDSVAYTVWLFILNAPPMVVLAWWRRGGKGLWQAMRTGWRRDLVGGFMALSGYGIAIWAMTHAPIALVAALRETSVIFALLIAKLWLKEPVGRWRTASALLVLAGIAALRLA
ncbi:hypothetical protein CHU95_11950 [Niveispirillum lacus]|uniref:EamA domain-containing protein n=1 Tax=Niveispirillum lacus TaxID=1981099 RepID=A0A255YY55_9PROT|nr:EamA family transporter [Niveispirillum lacus]OYQ34167.1 hypothetical protein CHU95_11950 [Niveispirillum lacus]